MSTDNSLRDALTRQLDTSWSLAALHLRTLTTEECLWRPAPLGAHVHETAEHRWVADWPDDESYAAGPPSIAWLTWHIGFWWTNVLEGGSFAPGDISWPGAAEATRSWIERLRDRWVALLTSLDDDDVKSAHRTKWPFTDRPFADVVAWVNVELTKNAAEIGYGRFLYAVRER